MQDSKIARIWYMTIQGPYIDKNLSIFKYFIQIMNFNTNQINADQTLLEGDLKILKIIPVSTVYVMSYNTVHLHNSLL